MSEMRRVERVDQLDEVLRLVVLSCSAAVKRAISRVTISRSCGRQRLRAARGVDAVIDVAHAVLDGAHAVVEGIDLDRVLHLLGEMHLQFGELADRRGDVVEPARQGRDIHLAALRHDLAEAGDLALEPLDLAGLADGAGQQFDHMRELRHLVGDVLHVGAGLDLRLDLALEPLEPAGQSSRRTAPAAR